MIHDTVHSLVRRQFNRQENVSQPGLVEGEEKQEKEEEREEKEKKEEKEKEKEDKIAKRPELAKRTEQTKRKLYHSAKVQVVVAHLNMRRALPNQRHGLDVP